MNKIYVAYTYRYPDKGIKQGGIYRKQRNKPTKKNPKQKTQQPTNKTTTDFLPPETQVTQYVY